MLYSAIRSSVDSNLYFPEAELVLAFVLTESNLKVDTQLMNHG